ncbi:glycosyltransferase [Pseudomonas sp. NPDC086581]|uniref:glycosyltransferase n=1 Tax=Pseudomonas sp. NPDC086581 TaxID=3364432 RepID=UPI0037F682FA
MEIHAPQERLNSAKKDIIYGPKINPGLDTPNRIRSKIVRKTDILLVNKYYSPSTGGIETAVKQYAHWYTELGYRVLVLCCAAERTTHSSMEQIDGIKVLRAASFGNLLSVPLSPAFFWHFTILAAKSRIIHLNLQFPLASMALWISRKLIKGKIVVSYHCDVYRQRYLKKLTYLFDRYTARQADFLLCGSPALKERSEVIGNIGRKVEVLPYTANLSHVDRCLNQPPNTLLPENFIRDGYCVFFGRLVSYKGTASLDAAFRLLMARGATVNLVVFGRGPEEQRFRKLAEEFPERVHFINAFVSDVDKYHLIRNARIFLFPSVYYSEAFGIAQLDAMACARPIINCWLQTGVNWVAPDGEAAVTIEAGNPDKLAGAIITLQNDPEQLAALGNGGLQRCRSIFSEDKVRARFIELISQL